VLCPFCSCGAESENVEGPGGDPGVMSAGDCDAGVSGHFKIPMARLQGGHDLGSAAGADLRSVFAVADIASRMFPGGRVGRVRT
jgi:hypothetical protein